MTHEVAIEFIRSISSTIEEKIPHYTTYKYKPKSLSNYTKSKYNIKSDDAYYIIDDESEVIYIYIASDFNSSFGGRLTSNINDIPLIFEEEFKDFIRQYNLDQIVAW